MFRKVLVPLDGTEVTEAILPYVSRLASGLQIPVKIVSVVDPSDNAPVPLLALAGSHERGESTESRARRDHCVVIRRLAQ